MAMQQKMMNFSVYQEPKAGQVDPQLKEAEDFARSIKDKLRTGQLTEEERKKCIQIALQFADRQRVQAIEHKVQYQSQPQGSWIKRKLVRDQMGSSDRACTPLRARNGNVSKPSRLRMAQLAADCWLASPPSEIRCA
uniref:Uncharacterized protein n=1 Tax=Pyramimonas obovata TaxID=1411642 RepID=A0A7S0RVB1_9CHLO|eukprot:CAMPEP_0118958230 /NCGR_PEP_ID=MMETSP1169-20130426/62516_1 /TAXON_ID=36882 /ORGANISM="Pyramimonas obovata, Strain CCMP722" /LENGTH=136 /DNA_ID=CAMNT_0006906345 /DNA_START=55 /DNA_END=465 /DNA_ORIENTATION=-